MLSVDGAKDYLQGITYLTTQHMNSDLLMIKEDCETMLLIEIYVIIYMYCLSSV